MRSLISRKLYGFVFLCPFHVFLLVKVIRCAAKFFMDFSRLFWFCHFKANFANKITYHFPAHVFSPEKLKRAKTVLHIKIIVFDPAL